MRSPTRSRGLALLPIIAILVAACGGSTSTTAPESGAPGASASAPAGSAEASIPTTPVTLNVWGGYPEMDAVYKAAGDAYHQLHPNVTVTVFSTDLRGFEQKLTTALPSNAAGDVIIRTTDFLSRFIDQNLFATPPADLQSLVTGGAYDKTVVDDATYNGQIWSVPEFVGHSALYYNKDMFTAAGLQPPTTMDEIVADASKLAKVDANGHLTTSGLSLRLSGQGSGVAEKFWIWLEQYGHSLIKEVSPGKWVADYNGPDGVKTFQMYVDMLKNNVDDLNIAADAAGFEKRATAMFVRESWVIGDINANAPDLNGHYGTVPMPVSSIQTTEGMFVPAASANQAVAWDFIRFLSQEKQQLSIATLAGWLPARKDLDYKTFVAQNPAWAGFLQVPDNYQFFNGGPKLPEFDEIETKIATHLVDAYKQYATLSGNPSAIQTMLNGWADETNSILKKNNNYGG